MGRVPTSRRNVFVYRFRINDISPSAGTYNGSRVFIFFFFIFFNVEGKLRVAIHSPLKRESSKLTFRFVLSFNRILMASKRRVFLNGELT